MNITINPFGDWRRMATVEVGLRGKDLPAVVRDCAMKFRLVEAASPRRQFRVYDLIVDSTEGERRCARTAWAVLSAMRNAATRGCIDQFRVVEGTHWLCMFETPGPAPVEDSQIARAI